MKLLYFIGLAVLFAAFGFGVGYDFSALQMSCPPQGPTQQAGQIPTPSPLSVPSPAITPGRASALKKQIQLKQELVNDLSEQLKEVQQPINTSKLDDLSNRMTEQARVLGDIAAQIQLQNQQAFLDASQENVWAAEQRRRQDLSLTQLQEQIRLAQSRVEELATTVRQLEANNVNYAELPGLNAQLQEAQSQLATLQDRFSETRSQAAVAADQKETYNQQQLENLRITVQQLQTRYQQELAKYENLQNDYQKLGDQEHQRAGKAEDLNDKLETEKHKLAELQRRAVG